MNMLYKTKCKAST